MEIALYLSLDVGTTVAKCVLFDQNGKEILVKENAYQLLNAEHGAAEQCPEEIKKVVFSCLQEVFTSDYKNQIRAICISTQGGSFLPVRADGTKTHNLITWMDTRAKDIVKKWEQEGITKLVRERSGWWVEEGLPLATIAWFKQNMPEEFQATDYFLSLNDYLAFLLTGKFITNPSCAGEMLLVNSKTGVWDDILCGLVGIKKDQLSTIQPADAIIGSLSEELKSLFGISQQIPVINGGQDHTLEALAVGLTGKGKTLLACGTAWVINSVAKDGELAAIPPNMGANFHVMPNQWIISQYIGCFGGVMEWWIQQMWQSPEKTCSRSEIYERLNKQLLAKAYTTEDLYYFPLSGGRQMNISRDGGIFWGSNLHHTREQFTLAVMEGAAFEVRWALENLAKHNFHSEELWMIGGAARSVIWTQMMADILGIPIYTSNYSHGPALGAAMIAAVTLGDFVNYEDSRNVFKISHTVIAPNAMIHRELSEKFIKFMELSKNLML